MEVNNYQGGNADTGGAVETSQYGYPVEEIGQPLPMDYYGTTMDQTQTGNDYQHNNEYPGEYLGEDDMNPMRKDAPEESLKPSQKSISTFFGNSGESVEKLEQTLGVIKPEAMPHVDEIFTIIRREGLAILKVRRVHLTAEQASQFYQDKYETPDFSEAVAHMYSGPILALVLSGPSAIDHWKRLIGPPTHSQRMEEPKCLRAKFGVPGSDIKNGLHASETEADALRELHFFFPELIVEPILADSLAAYYLNENVHPVLTIGLSKLVRERPEDPVMWLADWLLANNPNKPKEYGRNSCQ
jgi:nucleoside-diphosphate kinase